jgi:hypothetical protein
MVGQRFWVGRSDRVRNRQIPRIPVSDTTGRPDAKFRAVETFANLHIIRISAFRSPDDTPNSVEKKRRQKI